MTSYFFNDFIPLIIISGLFLIMAASVISISLYAVFKGCELEDDHEKGITCLDTEDGEED